MATTDDDFGVRVKELREQLHLTQEAMAETLGVSFVFFSMLFILN